MDPVGGGAHAASVFVQHQNDPTVNPIWAFDSGPGYSLDADLLAGSFQIFTTTSPSIPVNNNNSGMLDPVRFTNDSGATVILPAGSIHASVHADLFHGPTVGGANVHLAMPPLQLDPGARLELFFSIGGDAFDSSSVNVFNTLGFALRGGVTLTNDVGESLDWVSVPEPSLSLAWMAGVGFLCSVARGRRSA